ncbi:hypothetical protein NC652_038574 [Populus alba x Populus x berolinensis]|nr:hypothetical protein NC652_038574 [Populus alba x Populus x berolinensis]
MLQVCMFSVLFSSICSHANYSTKSMRNKGGYEVIKKAIEKPGLRHAGQIAASVEGNGQRLADRHETSDIKTFKWVSLTQNRNRVWLRGGRYAKNFQ